MANTVCEYCAKSFVRADSLLTHMCEKKRRVMARDEKSTKWAFIAFERFWKAKVSRGKTPTLEQFENSKMYKAFVEFGKWLIDYATLNPITYIDYLIKMERPLNDWSKPIVYETWLRELNKTETPSDALERNILLMQQWAVDTGEHWSDFFRKVAPAQAALWIQSGRLSPWVLFSASSAECLMDRIGPEQQKIIEKSIDTNFWRLKLERHADEVLRIKDMLNEADV